LRRFGSRSLSFTQNRVGSETFRNLRKVKSAPAFIHAPLVVYLEASKNQAGFTLSLGVILAEKRLVLGAALAVKENNGPEYPTTGDNAWNIFWH
jgi:hypothetical protein